MQFNPAHNLTALGGKAFHLEQLREICRVPPYFVISFSHPEEIREAEVQRSILEYWKEHEFGTAAVRSSASVEDSFATSFAGIFETILGVTDDDLIASFEQVLDSIKDERVADYCQAHGIAPEIIRMNVIVQRLISSRVSGVCITQVNGASNSLVIEACFGLGEALVSGQVTPDTYFVNRETLLIESRNIGYQETWLQPNAKGKPDYQPTPLGLRDVQKLKDDELHQVAKAALLIEKHLSLFPADVEWAFENDELFVLQARRFTGYDLA